MQPERKSLLHDDGGATTLEWALLLGGVALPGFLVIGLCLKVLLGHYQMITFINSLPFP